MTNSMLLECRKSLIAFERQYGRSCHLDQDLLIVHKVPDDQITAEYVEKVLAHGGNADAVLYFAIGDLKIEGEVDVLSVVDGLQFHFAHGDLLFFIYRLFQ